MEYPISVVHKDFKVIYNIRKTKECYKDKVLVRNTTSNYSWFMKEVNLIGDLEKGIIIIIPPALKILFGEKL